MSEINRLPGDPPSRYEGDYGFSRTISVDGFVIIGGTTSVTPEGVVVGQTPREQTAEILRKLVHELERAGVTPGDVVQARVYVTDISRAHEVGLTFGEVFSEVRPLMTMVEVSALIDPRMQVEIELSAYRRPGSA